MTSPAPELLAQLRGHGLTLGAAESLTGGLVCAALTDVPGASDVVRGAVVSYATQVKAAVLGVPAALLAEHGAVSQGCAEAMAVGARRVLDVDWAVSTTGVAGPGPSEGHPAGTVHVAVVGTTRDGEQITAHQALHLDGSRSRIRSLTVDAALTLLHRTLQEAWADVLPPGLSDSRGTVGHHADPSGSAETTKEG